jgi:hypothetical protein
MGPQDVVEQTRRAGACVPRETQLGDLREHVPCRSRHPRPAQHEEGELTEEEADDVRRRDGDEQGQHRLERREVDDGPHQVGRPREAAADGHEVPELGDHDGAGDQHADQVLGDVEGTRAPGERLRGGHGCRGIHGSSSCRPGS